MTTQRDILLATDGSSNSFAAAEYYLNNLFNHERDHIHIVSVVPIRPGGMASRRPSDPILRRESFSDDYSAANRQIVERIAADSPQYQVQAQSAAQDYINHIITQITSYCQKKGIPSPRTTPYTPVSHSSRDALVDLTHKLNIKIIVIGARGHGGLSAPTTPISDMPAVGSFGGTFGMTSSKTNQSPTTSLHPGGGLGRVAEYCMHNTSCAVVIVKER